MTAFSIWHSKSLGKFKLSEAIQINDDSADDWQCVLVFNAADWPTASVFYSLIQEPMQCII